MTPDDSNRERLFQLPGHCSFIPKDLVSSLTSCQGGRLRSNWEPRAGGEGGPTVGGSAALFSLWRCSVSRGVLTHPGGHPGERRRDRLRRPDAELRSDDSGPHLLHPDRRAHCHQVSGACHLGDGSARWSLSVVVALLSSGLSQIPAASPSLFLCLGCAASFWFFAVTLTGLSFKSGVIFLDPTPYL